MIYRSIKYTLRVVEITPYDINSWRPCHTTENMPTNKVISIPVHLSPIGGGVTLISLDGFPLAILFKDLAEMMGHC